MDAAGDLSDTRLAAAALSGCRAGPPGLGSQRTQRRWLLRRLQLLRLRSQDNFYNWIWTAPSTGASKEKTPDEKDAPSAKSAKDLETLLKPLQPKHEEAKPDAETNSCSSQPVTPSTTQPTRTTAAATPPPLTKPSRTREAAPLLKPNKTLLLSSKVGMKLRRKIGLRRKKASKKVDENEALGGALDEVFEAALRQNKWTPEDVILEDVTTKGFPRRTTEKAMSEWAKLGIAEMAWCFKIKEEFMQGWS